MLYYTFERPDNLVYNVDVYFKNTYNPKWFDDPYVKEMVKDVDNTVVFDRNVAVSPILGPIPVHEISGGVKMLIMALKTDIPLYGPAFGDNCLVWLKCIAEKKDITLVVGHLMPFGDPFHAIFLPKNLEINLYSDFVDSYMVHEGYMTEEDDEYATYSY